MSGGTLLGIGLVILGALLGAPGLLLVGGLTIFSRWLVSIWSRYGLDSIDYDRRLGTERAVWGDRVSLDVEVWNRKLLPVPLLTADDRVADALQVRPLTSETPGEGRLHNAWSLLWYERVVRHLAIDATRRGTFSFGPVRLTVSDLFERGTRSEERELWEQLTVRPRTVAVRSRGPARAPLGTLRARASLFDDPARIAGVRAYQPGDPMRRIHWRASARLRTTVSRRYEPAHERVVLLAVDVQTVSGPHWMMLFDEEQLEALCVAAASIARQLLHAGTACGLLIAAPVGGARRWAYIAPRTGSDQLGHIEDVIARVGPIVSLPFESLLEVVPRRLASGATLVTLAARDPGPYLPILQRLDRSGFRVVHVALGPTAPVARAMATELGLDARTAELGPTWRSADALVMAP